MYGDVCGVCPIGRRAIDDEFVARLAQLAQEAERIRRLPAETIADLTASGFTELLVPARFGGQQAELLAILDPVRMDARLLCPAQLDARPS